MKIASIFAIFLFISTAPAEAYLFPGHPQCPWNAVGHTWRDFLAGRYPPYRQTKPFFSAKFTRNIVPLVANQCYTVAYMGNGNWSVSGYNSIKKASLALTHNGGTPDEFKMTVWGHAFSFNEAGEIIDTTGAVTGNMVCHIGSDC